MNALFWNIYNKNIQDPLIELVRDKDCHIVFLAESENLNMESVCNELSRYNLDFSVLPKIGSCRRINAIMSNRYYNAPLEDDSYFTIRQIHNAIEDYIFVSLHIPTLQIGESEKAAIIRRMIGAIERAESIVNHNFTVVVGDFNLNPFDSSILSADVMCGIPTIEEARKGSRTVNYQKYSHFYNPMWKLFGRLEPPYGTFYYPPTTLVSIYWHMFDQVIIRSSLIERFQHDKLEIISQTRSHDLLNKQKPNKDKYSDHLPLFFSIEREV